MAPWRGKSVFQRPIDKRRGWQLAVGDFLGFQFSLAISENTPAGFGYSRLSMIIKAQQLPAIGTRKRSAWLRDKPVQVPERRICSIPGRHTFQERVGD